MSKVLTPEFRVSFPAVFKPQAAMEGQEPTYNIQMLFPKTTDLSALKKAVKEAIVEKWGANPPKTLRLPFKDGDEKDYDTHKGHIYINAKSKIKPGLVDQDLQEIISPEDFYGGCYARATLTVYSYDRKGNQGVAFGLQNIQKLRDGERFSARSSAADDFGGSSATKTSSINDDLDF